MSQIEHSVPFALQKTQRGFKIKLLEIRPGFRCVCSSEFMAYSFIVFCRIRVKALGCFSFSYHDFVFTVSAVISNISFLLRRKMLETKRNCKREQKRDKAVSFLSFIHLFRCCFFSCRRHHKDHFYSLT